jgi:hypothetical protein
MGFICRGDGTLANSVESPVAREVIDEMQARTGHDARILCP